MRIIDVLQPWTRGETKPAINTKLTNMEPHIRTENYWAYSSLLAHRDFTWIKEAVRGGDPADVPSLSSEDIIVFEMRKIKTINWINNSFTREDERLLSISEAKKCIENTARLVLASNRIPDSLKTSPGKLGKYVKHAADFAAAWEKIKVDEKCPPRLEIMFTMLPHLRILRCIQDGEL